MIKLIIDLLSFLYLNMKSIILLISITGFHRREQKVIWVPIAKNLGDIFFDKFITRYLLEFLQSFMNSFALATTRQLREHYNVLNLYFWHMHAKTQSLATREYVNLAVRQNKVLCQTGKLSKIEEYILKISTNEYSLIFNTIKIFIDDNKMS